MFTAFGAKVNNESCRVVPFRTVYHLLKLVADHPRPPTLPELVALRTRHLTPTGDFTEAYLAQLLDHRTKPSKRSRPTSSSSSSTTSSAGARSGAGSGAGAGGRKKARTYWDDTVYETLPDYIRAKLDTAMAAQFPTAAWKPATLYVEEEGRPTVVVKGPYQRSRKSVGIAVCCDDKMVRWKGDKPRVRAMQAGDGGERLYLVSSLFGMPVAFTEGIVHGKTRRIADRKGSPTPHLLNYLKGLSAVAELDASRTELFVEAFKYLLLRYVMNCADSGFHNMIVDATTLKLMNIDMEEIRSKKEIKTLEDAMFGTRRIVRTRRLLVRRCFILQSERILEWLKTVYKRAESTATGGEKKRFSVLFRLWESAETMWPM